MPKKSRLKKTAQKSKKEAMDSPEKPFSEESLVYSESGNYSERIFVIKDKDQFLVFTNLADVLQFGRANHFASISVATYLRQRIEKKGDDAKNGS